jgi:DNA polymerase elongation subunit (family B)
MRDMLLGISSNYLYLHGKFPVALSEVHRPYFLAFTPHTGDIESARNEIMKKWKDQSSSNEVLSKIEDIGEIENYRSFWDFDLSRKIFKVYTKKSYFVPEVSDYLFFHHGLYTGEHDIPYQQRALVDLAAAGTTWLFDTMGKKETVKVLVYDIETTQYSEGIKNIPIDIIGYSDFDIVFESEKNLEDERFSFDILDCPSSSKDVDVVQLVSHNIDEEIDSLCSFCKTCMSYGIISGHNILGFDNLQIYHRINDLLRNYKEMISDEERKTLQHFVTQYCSLDRSFHFGVGSEVGVFYPCTFDTYLATRKFYPFLDAYSLKAVAPFLGVEIKDRVVLTPSQIHIDTRTLKYNKQDVQEQVGVTLNLIQQALPLAFTTCMPFDLLLESGAVNMWDHMALIRGAVQKKIMPPICRPMTIAQNLLRHCKRCTSKEGIIRESMKKKEQLSKEFIRVLKYGEEMPEWVRYPYVIYNEKARDADEKLNYHIPGGMTIKPDKDARSHFVPWWSVVVADVGAMYPTILKAMNIGADTVKLCSQEDKPDDKVWLKKLPTQFLDSGGLQWEEITSGDSFADKGYKIGIQIDRRPGVVNCAMSGIMSMIAKVKEELRETEEQGDKEELNRLRMMYQSVKGARNAGTHGILSAPNVSGRQFNLWGAAAITTKGQMILSDSLNYLRERGIRVIYGDTDGIYMGCSRSVTDVPGLAQALGTTIQGEGEYWLTRPEDAIAAIQQCNLKWREKLNYPGFELEPEIHDAMIFVKHKNYLIFDHKNTRIEMVTKGNNFKGSDKADIARKVLEKIMISVLRENYCWENEEEVREAIKNSIKNKTREVLLNLDLSQVDIDDLTLIQSVQPARRYKPNQDGSISTFGRRAEALEKLLGQPIRARMKFKFVVTKKPLPGISKPSKSGVKPIDYMYPVSLLKDKNEIDLDWYKKMIENFVQGAFGLSDIAATEQTGLDAWM